MSIYALPTGAEDLLDLIVRRNIGVTPGLQIFGTAFALEKEDAAWLTLRIPPRALRVQDLIEECNMSYAVGSIATLAWTIDALDLYEAAKARDQILWFINRLYRLYSGAIDAHRTDLVHISYMAEKATSMTFERWGSENRFESS